MLQKVNMPVSLPPLVEKSGACSKSDAKLGKNKKVSFTTLYRKAVIDKEFCNELELNKKEMEFMGLLPVKPLRQADTFRSGPYKIGAFPVTSNEKVYYITKKKKKFLNIISHNDVYMTIYHKTVSTQEHTRETRTFFHNH